VKSQYGNLIDNLVVTTDSHIRPRSTTPNLPAQLNVQGAEPPIDPIWLVWSAALRLKENIIIDTSIAYVVCGLILNHVFIRFPESDDVASILGLQAQATSDKFGFS